MNIGLVTGEFPPMPGGVGDYSRILAEQLFSLGHHVHIFSRSGTASKSFPLSTTGAWGPGSLARIRNWARRRELDVVNLQFQTAAFDMSPYIHFLPRLLPTPLITTFHDLRYPYLFPKAGPLRNWIVLQLARASSGVITTNSEDDERLKGLRQRKLIPIGSNIRARAQHAPDADSKLQEAGANLNSFLLGHFGFVSAGKGVDCLIEAVSRLRKSGYDFRLVFIGARRNTVDAGGTAAYLQALDKRLRDLGLAEVVYWTGYLPEDEVAAWLRAVNLVTLPYQDGASYRRGSLIAALHQGCAVVTTQPSTRIDAFEHGRNMWLVPRRSPDAIAEALLILMRDRKLLARMRAGARQLSQCFDWDRIACETVAFYGACL